MKTLDFPLLHFSFYDDFQLAVYLHFDNIFLGMQVEKLIKICKPKGETDLTHLGLKYYGFDFYRNDFDRVFQLLIKSGLQKFKFTGLDEKSLINLLHHKRKFDQLYTFFNFFI